MGPLVPVLLAVAAGGGLLYVLGRKGKDGGPLTVPELPPVTVRHHLALRRTPSERAQVKAEREAFQAQREAEREQAQAARQAERSAEQAEREAQREQVQAARQALQAARHPEHPDRRVALRLRNLMPGHKHETTAEGAEMGSYPLPYVLRHPPGR